MTKPEYQSHYAKVKNGEAVEILQRGYEQAISDDERWWVSIACRSFLSDGETISKPLYMERSTVFGSTDSGRLFKIWLTSYKKAKWSLL